MQRTRKSASPPGLHHNPSKRDKRRLAIEHRLRDYNTQFNEQRDSHLRNQLSALSRDLQFITRANLYQNSPLDDRVEDVFSDITSVAGTASIDGDARPSGLGQHANQFVDEVDDILEERDAQLASVWSRYKQRAQVLSLDFEFSIQSADAEYDKLMNVMKERLVGNMRLRRKAMQKARDTIEVADSASLLQDRASLGFLMRPSSPEPIQSNRKTRHTRHKLDSDRADGEQTRKRRMPESETISDPNDQRFQLDSHLATPWEQGEAVQLHCKLGQLFSDKELGQFSRIAGEGIAQSWATRTSNTEKHPFRLPKLGTQKHAELFPERSPHLHEQVTADIDSRLSSLPMERAGSHATRSTRLQQVETNLRNDVFEQPNQEPRRIIGTALLDAYKVRGALKDPHNRDFEIPFVSGYTQQEQEEDLIFVRSLLEV